MTSRLPTRKRPRCSGVHGARAAQPDFAGLLMPEMDGFGFARETPADRAGSFAALRRGLALRILGYRLGLTIS
jgi:hypothetical protein